MPSKNMCKVIAFLAIFIPLAMVSGEEVSLQPPPVYQEKLAPLLTPLDEVLHAQPVQKDGDDGVILLDEVIHYLDEKGGRCMVFHRINKAWNDSGVKDLAALALDSRTTGAHSVSSLVRVGHAPNEITKAAKELDADLIIISTHGYTSWQHFCIGSTTERVVRSAPCPVLVVREKEHEFV